MKTIAKLSETAKLEKFHLALTNATTNAEIAETLSRFGLSAETLEEGATLLATTRKAYEFSNSQKRKRNVAYREFYKQKEALSKLYATHRKMAKLIFEEDRMVYESLGLRGKYKAVYVDWIEMLKTFYNRVNEDASIKEKLAQLKITVEELDAAIAAIPPLEKARAAYMFEKGTSQDSTNVKRKAFARMDDWMKHFFDLSRVAFRKQPQLMESFGMAVKN